VSAVPISYRALNRTRTGVQVLAVAFLVAVPVLNWLGVHWLLGTLYSLSIGGLDIADPAMALQSFLLTRSVYVPLLLAVVIPVGIALAFGRVFCSWICPYNTIHDWLDRIERRVLRGRWLRRHRRVAGRNPRRAVYWAVFATLLIVTALVGLPVLAYLSAPGILSSQLSRAILGPGVGPELALVAALMGLEVVIARRVWCTYACPVGATLALFRTPRTLRVIHHEARCTCPAGASPCTVACPLGLVPRRDETLAPYCYTCGACVAACEKTRRGALSFGFVPERHMTPTEVR
jgi:ferredoxin-type protein NapH